MESRVVDVGGVAAKLFDGMSWVEWKVLEVGLRKNETGWLMVVGRPAVARRSLDCGGEVNDSVVAGDVVSLWFHDVAIGRKVGIKVDSVGGHLVRTESGEEFQAWTVHGRFCSGQDWLSQWVFSDEAAAKRNTILGSLGEREDGMASRIANAKAFPQCRAMDTVWPGD